MTALDLIEGVFTRAPIWVWPLFLWMAWTGVRAMKARSTPVWTYWLLPLFALFSVHSRLHAGRPEFDLPFYAAAFFSGLMLGYWFQGRVIIEKSDRRVAVKGEVLTFIMLMTIFWMNFAGGVLSAVAPEVMASMPAIALLASIGGIVSGLFAGRALRVLRAPVGFVRPSDPQARPAH